MRENSSYNEIYKDLHTIVLQTSSLRTLLHKLEVCATVQSGGLGPIDQKCAYIFGLDYKIFSSAYIVR